MRKQFPRLFEISNDVGCSVHELALRGWNLSLRRWLADQPQLEMNMLHNKLISVALNSDNDTPICKWSKSGKCTVKSMCNMLSSNGPDWSFRHLLKARISLKFRIWLWSIWHNAIATKDNMVKRNWEDDTSVVFALILKPFIICSSLVLLLSILGVRFNLPLGLTVDHLVFFPDLLVD